VNIDFDLPAFTNIRDERAHADSLVDDSLSVWISIHFHLDDAAIGSIFMDSLDVKLENSVDFILFYSELLVHREINMQFHWRMLPKLMSLSSV
jgi:hypothetical protein